MKARQGGLAGFRKLAFRSKHENRDVFEVCRMVRRVCGGLRLSGGGNRIGGFQFTRKDNIIS